MTDSTEQAPPQAKLSLKTIAGYGAGDAANNLAFAMSTMFLLVYYTDVAGISAAAAGTLMLVVRIFDAFTDLIAGRIVDRTNTKRFGKFRPFILFGSLPLLVLSFLTFNVPQIGESGALIYAYVTYTALGLAYTFVNIPYGSLAGAMTQVPGERAKLSSARSIGAVIVSATLGIVVAPLITPENDLQQIFTTATLIFVVIGFALYLFTFFTAKERVHRAVPKVSMRQSFAILKDNRPLGMLCLSAFLFLTGMLAMSTVQLYYVRDVLGAIELYAYVSIVQVAGTFGIGAVLPAVVRALGKRNAYMAGGMVVVAGGLIALFAPSSQPFVGFAGLVIATLAVSFTSMLVWALEADTVEYGEWKTGVRAEGIIYAFFSFTRKSGQAVGGALAAYALALGSYTAGDAVQSVEAEWAIRIAVGAIPAAFALLAVLVMLAYPLTDKRHREIVAEIAQRRADTIDPSLSTAAFATRGSAAVPPIKES